MANKRLYCTKNALNTINARNTLMTAVFEPTVSTQYWTKDSREKSAMYFNWRLISNPVLFYNEMVAYYEAT